MGSPVSTCLGEVPGAEPGLGGGASQVFLCVCGGGGGSAGSHSPLEELQGFPCPTDLHVPG